MKASADSRAGTAQRLFNLGDCCLSNAERERRILRDRRASERQDCKSIDFSSQQEA